MNNNYNNMFGQSLNNDTYGNQPMYQGNQSDFLNNQMSYQGEMGMYQNDNMQISNNNFDTSTISEYKFKILLVK